MIVIRESISQETFNELARDVFMVKVAVDTSQEILAAGCELHVDCAEKLAEEGSSWKDLWGANIYPQDKKIDFLSLINVRPPKNRSMDIQDAVLREKVEVIMRKLLLSWT